MIRGVPTYLRNPSGVVVDVLDDAAPRLLEQGFQAATEADYAASNAMPAILAHGAPEAATAAQLRAERDALERDLPQIVALVDGHEAAVAAAREAAKSDPRRLPLAVEAQARLDAAHSILEQ